MADELAQAADEQPKKITVNSADTAANILAPPEDQSDAPADQPAGVPEGTELPNEHGTEVVVHDKDEAGNIVGWHKELK